MFKQYGRFLTTVVCVLFVTQLMAHPGYYGTAFHAHTIDQALAVAAKENKLVFIHVSDNDRGWRHFRWPNKESSGLIDLLVRETVIVELNIKKDAAQLAAFDISTPQILIVDSRQKVLEQLSEHAVVELVQDRISQYVTSEDGLARIDAALASGNNPFFNRERKAAALALAGKVDASIKQYQICLQESMADASLAAKSRRPQVIGAMLTLAEKYPAAKQALLKGRQRGADHLSAYPNNSKLSSDIARIDLALNQKQASMKLFKRLPQGSRARNGMFDYISEDLQQKQQYEELLSLIEPLKAIQGEITLYQRNKILHPVSAERGNKRGSRAFVIQRGLMIAEALAAVQRDEDYQSVVNELVQFDQSKSVRKSLQKALLRAGRTDLSQ
ncbi:hypothetical protein [Pleionea sp. CnH1-48]|uniref:hypothetical protein n=1 Tax=Pleionea sp. CnH1-48 TaxID=2954494 RepID=UPI002097AAE5|nr:hypothetical protein [Pleionea sp. CnH1-48]MCO7223577.1 hypothetical protein [Pleionea sp. CnH1-48]